MMPNDHDVKGVAAEDGDDGHHHRHDADNDLKGGHRVWRMDGKWRTDDKMNAANGLGLGTERKPG